FYQPVWQFTGIFDLNSAVSFAAVIIFGTAIAFCAYLESTKYLSPTQISVFASLEPFASIILSIIFLHINFGFIELIGAFIIIAAVTILNL
ncbi:MAG TPA: DMT family transporter, partial [Megamonas hypermegale]|nr:DMT family transporter [Megamonas hypermegale]